MTPEELDKARVKEARRLWHEQGAPHPQPIYIAARLAREGWTPPAPISPRVKAAREWLKGKSIVPAVSRSIDQGEFDDDAEAVGFLAGFAAAVKLAEPVVKEAKRLVEEYLDPDGDDAITTYRQSIGEGE